MTLARLPPPFVLQANVSNIKLSDKTFTYSICKGAMIDVSLTGEWFVGACMPAWHKSECMVLHRCYVTCNHTCNLLC